MADIYLKKKEERRIEGGHHWVFSNEVMQIEGEPANGELCSLFTSTGKFLGAGFWNKNSLICLRLLAREKTDNAEALIKERIISAEKLRNKIMSGRTAYRLVFGESDGLPGLVIDRYNDTYILQIHSAGMERMKQVISDTLLSSLSAKNVLTRNDMYFRGLEGLAQEDEVLAGHQTKETISIEGVKYHVDFSEAQKTGLFLDQAANRIYISRFTKNAAVLDVFCNSGGFGLHALTGGASEVVFTDISEQALHSVRQNCELNNFTGNTDFVKGDAFTVLKELHQQGKTFDIVIADPPAFVKSWKKLQEGIKGYISINAHALKLVRQGGFYATASCSHHISREMFLEAILKAAQKEGKDLRLLHFSGAGEDHPVLPAMPETEYLKFAFFAVG
ncbi:MAG: SAM-dependent methyltransferase [Ignavibacteriales bacterium]